MFKKKRTIEEVKESQLKEIIGENAGDTIKCLRKNKSVF